MKQVTQRLRDGRIKVLDLPEPALSPETVLVDVRASLLSAGTERMKVQAGQQSLVAKARARPDQVRQVLEKAQRDGVKDTVQTVRSRLDQPSSLGYSAAGVVIAVGARVPGLQPGDAVACAGAEYAVHADVVRVPANLCARVPEGVSFEDAAFTTVGSIALHGVHQAEGRLGERVAIIGLGLVGQLCGQILRAAGCEVAGVDLAPRAVDSALRNGAIDVGYARSALDAKHLPLDVGDRDGVIITAATTSDDPVVLAAELCRDRGRVVIVGHVGMTLPRGGYYGKELELRLSRSYGPGRYDSSYEEHGVDYPIGYVRWTEQRNMSAVLGLIANRRINVDTLVSDRLPVERAPEAYERLLTADPPLLALLLQYKPSSTRPEPPSPAPATPRTATTGGAGVIGAGSFAQGVLIPALRESGWPLVAVASAMGRSAQAAAERFEFQRADSADEIIAAPDVGLVVVCTRHSTHAELSLAALAAGKSVFVEKPPCLDAEELAALRRQGAASPARLTVGFNRRHAPFSQELREHVRRPGLPFELLFRVNAGRLPAGHWLNDLSDGGGRLLGEGCHFIDFACWFAGEAAEHVTCTMSPEPEQPLAGAQSFALSLSFKDRSLATILYGAAGANRLGKEYVEAHCAGRSGVIDDFRSLTLWAGRRRRTKRSRASDKGHRAQFVHLKDVANGITSPLAPSPLDSMATTLAALVSAQTGRTVAPSEV
ncbi:MAG: bi-domain-containing oxidoreductase [Actinomycetota bacterium]|nr:bi-domain-containing oxidoreductase [Actinomycetota bacterium]